MESRRNSTRRFSLYKDSKTSALSVLNQIKTHFSSGSHVCFNQWIFFPNDYNIWYITRIPATVITWYHRTWNIPNKSLASDRNTNIIIRQTRTECVHIGKTIKYAVKNPDMITQFFLLHTHLNMKKFLLSYYLLCKVTHCFSFAYNITEKWT